jgi:hypothetical protein
VIGAPHHLHLDSSCGRIVLWAGKSPSGLARQAGPHRLGDPVSEGVAFLEEDAVDLGAKAAVDWKNRGRQRQREHDLPGHRVDSNEAGCCLGQARHRHECAGPRAGRSRWCRRPWR